MKVASFSLLALSSLVERADAQDFECFICPGVGIQNQEGVVTIPLVSPDQTCSQLDINSANIPEEECPFLLEFATPVCCFEPVANGPTSSPTESLAPSAAPTGTPTSTPTISSKPSTSLRPSGNPTARPTYAPHPECYDFIGDIVAREKDVYDSTFYREYILCPNTEFVIGNGGPGGVYTNGDYPIFPRRNAGYKCGEDGKSSNNCRLVGGDFQLISFSGNWPEDQQEPHSNVTVSGVTFVSGGYATAILGNAGDVTFRDCIFTEHATIGALYALYEIPPDDRRRLDGKIEQHSLISTLLSGGDYNQWKKENERTIERQEEIDRKLQIVNPDILLRLDVVIIDCLFEGNMVAQMGGTGGTAVVTSAFPENNIQIYNSSFMRNMFNKPEVQLLGSVVEGNGAITIENCCFIDNECLRYGTVTMRGPRAVLTASGNYGNVIDDENLACDFAILFPVRGDFEERKNFECLKYDAPPDFDPIQCTLWSSSAPTVSPEPSVTPAVSPESPVTPQPTIDEPSDADAAAAAGGGVIISLSAAAAALTAFFIY